LISSQILILSYFFHTSQIQKHVNNLKDWHTVGKAKVTKFAFNKTPIKEMTGSYEIDQKQLTINKGQFIFDYSNYSLNHSTKESAQEGVLNVRKGLC